MQDQLVDCDTCETEPEEYECPQCGLTGSEIADHRWIVNLWSVISPN